MFTGIIEEIGVIESVKKGVKSSKLVIKGNVVLENTNVGDSISTNGVCLTVTNLKGNTFEVDVMAETLRNSNLANLRIGSKVNLERAVCLETRLGGHLVSGHIDGTGRIINLEKDDNAVWVTVEVSNEIVKYIVYKGSIAIDGISLTVANVESNLIKVSIIPHTSKETTLLSNRIGDIVNLECDLIAKYIEKIVLFNKSSNDVKVSSISEEFLMSNGFL